jgi:hypothetical protein
MTTNEAVGVLIPRCILYEWMMRATKKRLTGEKAV